MEEIKQKANLYGQSHIFQFWDILNDEEKIKFEEDLSTIDFEPIEPDFKKCLSQLEKIGQKLDSSIEPPPQECVFSSTKGPKEEVERFIKIGKIYEFSTYHNSLLSDNSLKNTYHIFDKTKVI